MTTTPALPLIPAPNAAPNPAPKATKAAPSAKGAEAPGLAAPAGKGDFESKLKHARRDGTAQESDAGAKKPSKGAQDRPVESRERVETPAETEPERVQPTEQVDDAPVAEAETPNDRPATEDARPVKERAEAGEVDGDGEAEEAGTRPVKAETSAPLKEGEAARALAAARDVEVAQEANPGQEQSRIADAAARQVRDGGEKNAKQNGAAAQETVEQTAKPAAAAAQGERVDARTVAARVETASAERASVRAEVVEGDAGAAIRDAEVVEEASKELRPAARREVVDVRGASERAAASAPTVKEHAAAEARREATDAAAQKALSGEGMKVEARAAGSSGGEQHTGQEERGRDEQASRAVDAAARLTGPRVASNGAERASPVFTVAAPGEAAQSSPTIAQSRPEGVISARAEVDEGAVVSQATRGLTAAVQQRGGSVTMRLQPESLGAMRIQMQIEQGVVTARFEAATPEARDLLSKHMETLRASLEAKGLSVDRLQVQLTSPGQGSQGGQMERQGSGAQQDAQRPTSHDAADGRSRGAYEQRSGGEDRGSDGRGENRWSRFGAERWDGEGMDSGRRAAVVARVGLDAVA